MERKVLVETSARHVHLSREHLDILFGKGYELTPRRSFRSGQYACEERVAVVGPKGTFPSVAILGPVRPASQVEVSASDARTLGLTPPVKESGDIKGSAGCKLVGPKGEVEISEGVIIAKRHIHLDPATAEKFSVQDKQVVSVKVESDERSLIFGDVVVRVNPNFAPAMHIDTDESNAVLACGEVMGVIID